jgi:hypothetical protein
MLKLVSNEKKTILDEVVFILFYFENRPNITGKIPRNTEIK